MWGLRDRTEHNSYESKISSLSEKVLYLYNNRNDLGIRNLIRNKPMNILVDSLEYLDNVDVIMRFLIVARQSRMGDLFLALSEDNKRKILEIIKPGVLSRLLLDLNTDDIYEIFLSSSVPIQKKIIFNASKELKEEIKRLKSFDFAQVGSIMNTTFLNLVNGLNVSEAINYLRINDSEFDIGEEVFVLNSDHEIEGRIKTKDLLFANPNSSIAEICEKSFFSIVQTDDIDKLIDLFKKYSVNSVAVVDSDDKLVGVINYQDVIPEILDSNIEDIHKFYGIKDIRKSYLSSNVMEIVKSRITCLLIMLFAATFTTFAIDKFEYLGVTWTAGLSSAILVPIIPIITDMCGNTGSQTAATIIQAVSAGELKESDFRSVIKKEFRISIIVGGILAFFNFLRLAAYFAIFPVDNEKIFFQTTTQTSTLTLSVFNFLLSTSTNSLSNAYGIAMVGSLSSSLSLWLVVIFSKFFGVLIPFTAIKLDYDPSSVSSPILTTILDTISSIIFFGIGVFLLHHAINPILGMTVNGGKLNSSSSS